MKTLLIYLFATFGFVSAAHAGTWGAFTWGNGNWGTAISTPGSCGSANGTAVTALPTSNLCSSGTASTVSGTGPWAWSCSDTNGGIAVSCSAPLQKWPLTLLFVGTGSGSVNGGMSCTSGAACSTVSFTHATNLTLIASPNAASTFDGWTGACSNVSGNCTVSMDRAKTVSVLFSAVPKAKVSLKSFNTLQAAYSDPATGTTADTSLIKLLGGGPTEAFTAAEGKTVIVNGGYNTAYTDITSETVLLGPVKIRSGAVRMKGVKVK